MAEALNPNVPNEESLFAKAVKNVELVAKLVTDTVGIGEVEEKPRAEGDTTTETEAAGAAPSAPSEAGGEGAEIQQEEEVEGDHHQIAEDLDRAGSEDEVDDVIGERGEGSDAGRLAEPSQLEAAASGPGELPLPPSDISGDAEELDDEQQGGAEATLAGQEPRSTVEPAMSEHAPDPDVLEQPSYEEELEGTTDTADAADMAGAIDPADTADATEAAHPTDGSEGLHALSNLARAPTPSSRTSTPPLGPGSAVPVAKKFSSININKKFLSKAASPSPGTPTGSSSKFVGLNGRATASPVPISSSSSRFLSSKISTIPSKSSTSPNPPAATPASSAASPWAVPVLPASESGAASQPGAMSGGSAVPTKPRMVTTSTLTMGSGQGIGGSANRNVWRAVPSDGRKAGLSRDFPTAKEVAEGKNQAALAAQAQAAHNQAIIQGLNAFTQLDANAHRWDDEDDDDGVIDFGDGTIYSPHEHPPSHVTGAEPELNAPVPKGERFMDDFDRSWPRRAPAPVEGLHRRADGDRVLFNAASNRLEPSSQKTLPQPVQPTRLMTRADTRDVPPHLASSNAAANRPSDRAPPPHLQPHDGSRQLPPHMTAPPPDRPSLPPQSSVATSSRPAWGVRLEAERQQLPHTHERRDFPPQSASFETTHSPPDAPMTLARRPSNQALPPPHAALQQRRPSHASSHATSHTNLPPTGPVDDQTAEMHTAAEKARLRRLAEEQEREAAAERARQKAKELEARLGLKNSSAPQIDSAVHAPGSAPAKPSPAVPQPPPQPTFTIAQRPKPPPPIAESLSTATALPTRQAPESRSGEKSWRSKMAQLDAPGSAKQSSADAAASAQQSRISRPVTESISEPPAGATAPIAKLPPAASSARVESGVESSPSQNVVPVKHESTFDSMLARIQAAMKENRAPPTSAVHGATGEPAKVTPQESAKHVVQSISEHPPVVAGTSQPLAESSKTSSSSSPASEPAASMTQFFDVTQLEIPRSPPPVWRTYAVKLPKDAPGKPSISEAQLRKSENPSQLSRAWIMTFAPPIDGLDSKTLSRAEFLLPRPVVKRFARVDSSPVVSISPRRLEPFERKTKKKLVYNGPNEVAPPAASAESLLPSSNPSTASASATLMAQRTTAASDRWKKDLDLARADALSASAVGRSDPATPVEARRKSKSPVKASPAAQAEKDGLFSADGVLGATERGRLAEPKPGVRFMVSSELEGDVARFEGDILLDEVNKMSLMSLEGVEEGGKEEVDPKPSGAETPKTPPSVSGASSRGHTSSPNAANGTSTPWSNKASARSSSQHDSIRSVWEPPNESTFQASASTPSFPSSSTPVIPGEASNTPMYPSLNAPSSSSDLASTQPASMKMSYSQSQPFSSPGTSAASFGMRQSPHYGYTAADQQSMMGLQYASLGARANGMSSSSSSPGWAGASMNQQGVWSPSAFGTSLASPAYAYGSNKNGSTGDAAKAAMAFNAAGSKEMAYAAAYPGYGPQGYNHQQQGYTGRPAAAQQYGYGYGAPGQIVGGTGNARPAGRFAQANGASVEYGANGGAGGAHGGGGGAHHQQQQRGGYYGGHHQQQQAQQQQAQQQQQQAQQQHPPQQSHAAPQNGGAAAGMFTAFNGSRGQTGRGGKMW